MAFGTLVSESLRIGARLDAVRLDVTKIWRAAAVEYARTHGVPDAQLDWPE